MVNPIQRTAQLTPVAQPVDTYVQPAKSQLRDIAQSLGGFNANLQELLDARNKKEQEDERTQATADAITGAGPGAEAAAVRGGRAPAQYSPNYMKQYSETQGSLQGGQLQEQFSTAWNNWDGKDSDDPAAYDNFVQEFLKTHLDPNSNRDYLRGVLPGVNQLITNGRAQYVAYRNDTIQKRNIDNTVAVAATSIRTIYQNGLTTGQGTDLTLVNKATDETRAKLIAQGGNVADYDKAMMETVSALAIETGDEKLLSWFSKAPEGGVAPDATPDGLRIKNSTLASLRSTAGEKMTREAQLQEKQRKENLNKAHADFMQFIVKNRNAPVPEEILKAAEDNGDWEIRSKLSTIRDNLNKGDTNEDDLQAVLTEVLNTPNADPMDIVRRANENGVFKSYDDLSKAMTFAQSYKDNGDKIRSVETRASYTTAIKTIQDRTTRLNDYGNPIGGLSNDALQATYDFKRMMSNWLIDNPKATDQQIEDRINQVQTGILGDITANPAQLPGGKTEAGIYTRDPNLEFENPNGALPGNAAPKQNPNIVPLTPEEKGLPGEQKNLATPAPAPGAQPSKPGPTDDQIKKYIEKLPADKKAAIEGTIKRNQAAGKSGAKSIEDFAKQLLTVNPGLIPISYNPADTDAGSGDTRASGGFTPEQAEGWITNALQGASQTGFTEATGSAQNLLNLIGQGEAGGNYNAVFGAPASDVNLASFSVDDILARQQWARQNGYPSTAIGKYGFLYKTLAGLKAEGVVNGTEPFDKATQDKLGMALLNRRGYNEFLNGSLSKRAFALRLSQEWASLPNPETGASYYAGDGLNASRVPPSAVFSAMGASLTPASLGGAGLEGDDMGLRFVHPEQRAGVKRQLTNAVAAAYRDLGIDDPTVLSGYRDPNHPVEAAKGNGGGEHTHGNAVDVSLKGLSNEQRGALVNRLIANGVKRFITYGRSPDMLHIDLKDQTGNGKPYFMYNKSARYLSGAPQWFQDIAFGRTSI